MHMIQPVQCEQPSCLSFTADTPDDSSNEVDSDSRSPRMQQRKLQRSPKVVRRARPQPNDEEHGLELNLDIGGHGSRVPRAQNSRKRSADRKEKLSSRRTPKDGKTSVASGAAEAAGTHEHERRSGAEGAWAELPSILNVLCGI